MAQNEEAEILKEKNAKVRTCLTLGSERKPPPNGSWVIQADAKEIYDPHT